MNKLLALSMLGATTSCIATADEVVKQHIENEPKIKEKVKILNHELTISRHHNKGLPMNVFDGHQKEVAFVSLVAFIIELAYGTKKVYDKGSILTVLAHSFIMGGALSNTYDRLKKGYVVDYFSFEKGKAIYNISDLFIIAGAFLATYEELVSK